MSDENLEIPALSMEMQKLVASARMPDAVPNEVRARLLQRVRVSTGAPMPTPGPEAGGNPPSSTSPAPESVAGNAVASAATQAARAASNYGVTKLVVLAFGVGAAVGAGSYAIVRPTPPPEIREVVRQVVREVRVEVPVPVEVPAPTLRAPAVFPPPATRAANTAPPTNTPSEAVTDAQRQQERAVLTRAQSALARGRIEDALAALDEHAQTFPNGAFGEERDALRVRTLRAAGQNEAADRAAREFVRRYPRSIFRESVQPSHE